MADDGAAAAVAAAPAVVVKVGVAGIASVAAVAGVVSRAVTSTATARTISRALSGKAAPVRGSVVVGAAVGATPPPAVGPAQPVRELPGPEPGPGEDDRA